MALYEVANSIWKHQNLLRDIKDGLPYLALFLELVDSGAIALLRPWNELVRKSYLLASEQRIPAYGAAFIALSLELGLALETLLGQGKGSSHYRGSRAATSSLE